MFASSVIIGVIILMVYFKPVEGDDALVVGNQRAQSSMQQRPRNMALLHKEVPDLAKLLGYEDDNLDYVDNASGCLRNLGNTCYVNAMLHVLARIPSIRRWCSSHQTQFAESVSHPTDCVLCALAFDMSRLAVETGATAMAPRIAQERGSWSGGRFAGTDQHDVHDAFVSLMERCDQVDADAASFLGLREIEVNGGANSTRYSTPKWKAFGGIHFSEVTCHACGDIGAQYEMWDSLSLALAGPVDEPTTVEQLLSNHWGTEPLQVDDKCEEEDCRKLASVQNIQSWNNGPTSSVSS